MKRIDLAGKILFAVGVLSIFWKVEGFYGYGGYVDNTWEIIIVSVLICLTGIALIFIGKKITYKKKK